MGTMGVTCHFVRYRTACVVQHLCGLARRPTRLHPAVVPQRLELSLQKQRDPEGRGFWAPDVIASMLQVGYDQGYCTLPAQFRLVCEQKTVSDLTADQQAGDDDDDNDDDVPDLVSEDGSDADCPEMTARPRRGATAQQLLHARLLKRLGGGEMNLDSQTRGIHLRFTDDGEVEGSGHLGPSTISSIAGVDDDVVTDRDAGGPSDEHVHFPSSASSSANTSSDDLSSGDFEYE